MMSSVVDLEDFRSRAFYLSSAANASLYIHNRFAELGLWVEYQELIVEGFLVRNVIAVLNGTNPEAPQYLYGAHFDSANLNVDNYSDGEKFAAPGADDDASGVAATIELATVLHDERFESTIKFVAFAAEESGLNGSLAFVLRESARGVRYADTVIMDMIGYRRESTNSAFMFSNNASNTMVGAVRAAITERHLNLSLTTISNVLIDASDHYPFWLAGYPSVLVIEEMANNRPVNPGYHTENDTSDSLSMEQMTVITEALLAGFLTLQTPQEEKSSYAAWIISGLVIIAVVALSSLYVLRRRKVLE